MNDPTVEFQRHIRLNGKPSDEDATNENEESEEEVEQEFRSLGDDINAVHRGLKATQKGEAPSTIASRIKIRKATKAMQSKAEKGKTTDNVDSDENTRC